MPAQMAPAASSQDRSVDIALWILTAVCAAATFYFSFVSPPPGVRAFPHADKVQHAVAYFATTLSFLFAGVWRPGRGAGPFAWLVIWILPGVVAVGIGIEVLQDMTPTRSPEVLDVVAELMGAGAALVVHALVRRYWPRPAEGLVGGA